MVSKIAVWLFFCFVASFDIIGLIEGIKSVIGAVKKKSKLFWAPPVSFLLSLLFAYLMREFTSVLDVIGDTAASVFFGGATIFAIGELLGYNVIVKWAFQAVDSLVTSMKKKAGNAVVNTEGM